MSVVTVAAAALKMAYLYQLAQCCFCAALRIALRVWRYITDLLVPTEFAGVMYNQIIENVLEIMVTHFVR